jgi:hypothetical protein
VLKYFYNIITYLQAKVVSILRHGIRLNRLVIKYSLIEVLLQVSYKFYLILIYLKGKKGLISY